MLNGIHGGKKQTDQDSQAYFGAINALHQHVSNTIFAVDEIANNLSSEYSEDGLSNISKRFEDISKEFANFTIIANNSFYDLIHRSKSRLNAAKRVAQQSKSIAQLFEKYAKKPNSYSAVNSRIQINKLSGQLRNLEMYCISTTGSN